MEETESRWAGTSAQWTALYGTSSQLGRAEMWGLSRAAHAPPAATARHPRGREALSAFSLVTRSCLRGLPGGRRTGTLRPSSSGGTAKPPPFFRRGLIDGLPATRARSLTAARHLVDGCPSAPLGFRLTDAALFVTFFYVLGLALLLFRVFGFVAACHSALHIDYAFIARNEATSDLVPSGAHPTAKRGGAAREVTG
jgi:hypothetical protein